MEENKTIDKKDMLLVSLLYIAVIVIIVLLVFSIRNQKRVVKDSINNNIEVQSE